MSEIRLSWQVTQPVSAGYSSIRTSVFYAQPITGGYSSARLAFLTPQPLVGGYSSVRLSDMVIQALFPVPPERPVSTNPFPGFGNSTGDASIPAGKDPFNTPLPGLTFSVHKKPNFKTKVTEAANGNETRNALMQYPRWEFELQYEFLEDSSGADSSLRTIVGFFLARQGSFDTFLFKDPDDYQVTAGFCGTADGVTTEFPFCRTMGEFHEKVGQVDTDNTIHVYVGGVLVDPADYTVTLPNAIVFDAAPSSGDVTATFQFFFACRFKDDQQDYEKFMDQLWLLQSCSFKSVIQ